MAAPDPLQGQPTAAKRSMAANGLGGILRATGRKATVAAKEGTEQNLVGPDEELE